MHELDELRSKISSTDKEIARLFELRMNLAGQVIDYKVRSGLNIFDANQESKVIAGNVENISDPILKEYYVLFIKSLMEISKSYQYRRMSSMKISYSGTLSIIAAENLFPAAEFVSFPTYESAYKACENGLVDVSILPIYSAYSGNVGSVSDLAFFGSLYVNLMGDLSVHQRILGIPGSDISYINKVITAKESRQLEFGTFEVEKCDNLEQAADAIIEAQDKTTGILVSSENMQFNGLQVLDNYNNSTKFAVFSRVMNVPSDKINMNEHFILVFTVRNQAGALAKALNIIGSHGFNMSNLNSRHVKDMVWNNYFLVELEGHIDESEKDELFRQLNSVCDRLKIVGYYKIVKI